MSDPNTITVFEHQQLRVGQKVNDIEFTSEIFKALQLFHGPGVPYFSLANNGVVFNEHVGVLQVGKYLIEVLPKADKIFLGGDEKASWRQMLIQMLLSIDTFNLHAPSTAALSLKPNSILDLYIGLFVKELEYLLHTGLVKRYRKKEENQFALKGSIIFSKHLQHNIVHQERFYVRHQVYDHEHLLHQVLYKALQLVKRINKNKELHSRIGSLLLHFPPMSSVAVNEALFNRIIINRKTGKYQTALNIAKLLLLNYHPDITSGNKHVLALMFDMNVLWEEFVYATLRKHLRRVVTVHPKPVREFWRSAKGKKTTMEADIVLDLGKPGCIVLDTKWKNLGTYNPAVADLRQMFVYHEYYCAKKVALLYPGTSGLQTGKYVDAFTKKLGNKECSVISLAVRSNVIEFQSHIVETIFKWMQT